MLHLCGIIWDLSLWPTDSLAVGLGSVVTAHGLSCSMAGEMLIPQLRQTPHPLHCKVDSYPLDHQGKYPLHFLYAEWMSYLWPNEH